MAAPKFYNEKGPKNYEQKCPVVLVLDVSGSMSDDPLNELNKGLSIFLEDINKDPIASARLDLAIVSFGSNTKVELNFEIASHIERIPGLVINGSTKMVNGLREGIHLLEERKRWYKSTNQTYFRPYLILITDGYPDGDQDINGITKEIKQAAIDKKFNFWPIGVEGADMNLLKEMEVRGVEGSIPAMKLIGLEFVKLFKWLSSSFEKISKSKAGEGVDISPQKELNPFQFTVP